MPYRKPKEPIDLTGWLAPWEADVLRKKIDDLRDLLKRIRKAVHDALPGQTDPLELDAAIEVALRENAELGKRYEQLEQMVTRRMGELEAENARLRAEIETLRVRVADQERFIATLESGIHEENGVVLQLRAEIAQLRADAELAEEVIVEDDAELLRLRLECNDLRAENERLRDGAEAYCPAGHPARYYAGIEAVRCSICGLVDVAADDSDIGRDHIR